MKLESEKKRKRISFAETVECAENSSEGIQAHKRTKNKADKDIKEETSTITQPAANNLLEAEENDVWSLILMKSKSSGLNYEDAMKSFLLEKLRAVLQQPADDSVKSSYAEFMKDMSVMFGKLHRYPKMISKFLFCIRTEMLDSIERMDETKFGKTNLTELLLPTEFLDLLVPCVSLLPVGQIIDLWRTLHHNLEEECIKPLLEGKEKASLKIFAPIVIELLTGFMSSIKVSDSAMPATQIEKIYELMTKTEKDCLSQLGLIVKESEDKRFLAGFLKLAYTWNELDCVFHAYNPRYKAREGSILTIESSKSYIEILGGSESAANLSSVHPYISASSWDHLGKVSLESGEPTSALLVKLVTQKLKRLCALQHKVWHTEQNFETQKVKTLIRSHLVTTVSFLWLQQIDLASQAMSVAEINEILPLVGSFLPLVELVELASSVVAKLDAEILVPNSVSLMKDSPNFTSDLISAAVNGNTVLCSAVVLQLANEVVRKLGKMKVEKKFFKVLRSEIFSADALVELLEYISKGSTEGEQTALKFLNLLNEFLSEHENTMLTSGDKIEFAPELIKHILEFLCQLPVEQYLTEVKALVCLFSIPVFVGIAPMVGNSSDNLVQLVSRLIFKSGSTTRGSPLLFGVQWHKLFQWLVLNAESFSLDVLRSIALTVLKNIYVSPKSVEQFESVLDNMCRHFRMNLPLGDIALVTLEFLIEEIKPAVASKSKVLPSIENHLEKLMLTISTQLEVAPEFETSLVQDAEGPDKFQTLALARTFQSCFLVHIGSSALKSAKDDKNHLLELRALFTRHLESALNFLKKHQKKKSLKKLLESSPELMHAKDTALEFLLAVCKGSEFHDCLPSNFVISVWKYCCKATASNTISSLVQHIYQMSSLEDFQHITDGLIADIKNLSNSEAPDGTELARATFLVDKLIDATLSQEKKPIRWNVLEELLLGFLSSTICWKDYEDEHYFALVDLQIKVLRRRNAMCKLDTLAYCFNSIVSTPLNTIEDVSRFRKAFSKAAELLNAFVVHRLDVVSFRTHIVLQCFEYLVQSLTKKADQTNKLSDVEILDLRHCAHYIERICQSTKLGQKEFSRVSPYFLAILMRQVDVNTVYPAIKNPLLNGCYKLLDICDDHGVAQLNSMLSLGAREIFKGTFDLYKKYYRYTGKV